MWETWVLSLVWEDCLEKVKATHTSILAWRIPCTISSMGLQRVGHDSNFHFHSLKQICVHLFFDAFSRNLKMYLYSEMKPITVSVQFSSVTQSVVSDSLRPHESQHTRPPCPSPTPGVH